jgi:hypothetical protein
VRSSRELWLSFLVIVPLLALLSSLAYGDESDWIRPLNSGDPLVWGRRDGIVFGLPSQGGLPGPRGLIRVGVISPTTHQTQLLNFIAIEPVVAGAGSRHSRMAFSELEFSSLDPKSRGKRLWVQAEAGSQASAFRGTLSVIPSSPAAIERLTVRIGVERFTANGAHVFLIASIDSDRPGELNLQVHQESDSVPVEELTLTATMGNFERLRWLYLKDRTLSSLALYSGYTGDDFVEGENYPLDEMLRTREGDAIILCTSNEANPQQAAGTAKSSWHYPLPRLTQYWLVAARDIQPGLRVRVNARRVYWASRDPIPGGIAFENFEVRQRYQAGQQFTFGVTAKEPWAFEPPVPRLKRL